jgi:hypothetical protein
MTVFEYGGRLLVVDAGVLFPDADAPGVDLILPDFRPILDRLADIDALVLTHGHEDHIGAVPFLLRQRPDLLVVGSPFTLALVEAKCREHRLTPHLLRVNEGDRVQHGAFECEYLAVAHSIPQCLAVAIRTPAGVAVHTGDIKLDQLPFDGRLTDLPGFSRLGDEGVDLFLCDSTNADVPGVSPSEASLGPSIAAAIGSADRRVFVSCFASNVHRVQQIVDGAVAHGRRVCLLGRSMLRNMEIASELGLLTVPEGTMVGVDDLDEVPESQQLIVLTGSQGETMAALNRITRGEHRSLQMRSTDTVILSSSLIPGNEHAVFGMVNRMRRAGVTVIDNRNANVHVSGHAFAGSCCSSTTPCGPATSCRCTASGATCAPTPRWRRRPASPPTPSSSPRTASSWTSSTGARRSSGGSRWAGPTSTASPPATSRPPRWPTAWCSARAGSSRSPSRSTAPPGGRSPRPRCRAAGSPRTPRPWRRAADGGGRAGPQPSPTASPTPTASPSRCAGSSASGWGRPTAAAR